MRDFTPELSSFLDLLTGIELKSNQHLVINKLPGNYPCFW